MYGAIAEGEESITDLKDQLIAEKRKEKYKFIWEGLSAQDEENEIDTTKKKYVFLSFSLLIIIYSIQ